MQSRYLLGSFQLWVYKDLGECALHAVTCDSRLRELLDGAAGTAMKVNHDTIQKERFLFIDPGSCVKAVAQHLLTFLIQHLHGQARQATKIKTMDLCPHVGDSRKIKI